MRLRSEQCDEPKCLRNHEAAGTGLLDGVPDRVETDHADARVAKFFENRPEICLALSVLHINVNLFGRKRCPQDVLFSAFQRRGCEGKSWTRAVNAEEVGFACP